MRHNGCDRPLTGTIASKVGCSCTSCACAATSTHVRSTSSPSICPARGDRPFDHDDPPVLGGKAVGVLGWALPDVAIIDEHGLNDAVVARAPIAEPEPAAIEQTRAFLASQDRDGDGWVDAGELHEALAVMAPGAKSTAQADYFVWGVLTKVADERRDAVRVSDAERLHRAVFHSRIMAHERKAPAGYLEAFDPNVELGKGEYSIRTRERALSPERVREIEAQWRERVADQ